MIDEHEKLDALRAIIAGECEVRFARNHKLTHGEVAEWLVRRAPSGGQRDPAADIGRVPAPDRFSGAWQSGYRAEIRRRLAADFTGWAADRTKFDEQVENVIQALRADANARERPPEPRL